MLSVSGYDVQTAPSGDIALRMLQYCRVDLVIADYFLPGFTGAELVTAIRETQPEPLVVLLTAAPEGPAGTEKADLVLIKGMPPSRFLAAIENLLRTRKGGAGCVGSAGSC
jgi:DNA-binding response OmpR family regulator